MIEPYIEDGWLCEPCEPDYAPGISQAIPGSWSKPLVNLTELDGYDEMIAAAEKRGAARALREAAIEISDRDGSTARGIIWSDRDSIVSWLRNRADQEGDE